MGHDECMIDQNIVVVYFRIGTTYLHKLLVNEPEKNCN